MSKYIKKRFMEDIKQELLDLNFNIDSIGIIYWVEAIKFVKNQPLEWDMMNIYEYIADKYRKLKSRIERCMRNAIEPAKENIQNKYEHYGKIRNQTFLNLIRFKLI